MNVIIDSREQNPFRWMDYENLTTVRDKLDFADYSLASYDRPGDDDSVVIERKQHCQELLSNIGQNWERFQRELVGMSKYKHKFIIVCGPSNFDYLYNKGFTKISPNYAYKQLAYIYTEYGIPTLCFSKVEDAENFVYRLFVELIRKHG